MEVQHWCLARADASKARWNESQHRILSLSDRKIAAESCAKSVDLRKLVLCYSARDMITDGRREELLRLRVAANGLRPKLQGRGEHVKGFSQSPGMIAGAQVSFEVF